MPCVKVAVDAAAYFQVAQSLVGMGEFSFPRLNY